MIHIGGVNALSVGYLSLQIITAIILYPDYHHVVSTWILILIGKSYFGPQVLYTARREYHHYPKMMTTSSSTSRGRHLLKLKAVIHISRRANTESLTIYASHYERSEDVSNLESNIKTVAQC